MKTYAMVHPDGAIDINTLAHSKMLAWINGIPYVDIPRHLLSACKKRQRSFMRLAARHGYRVVEVEVRRKT
jgi:hypothetical protein